MLVPEEFDAIVPSDLADLLPVFLANRQRELEELRAALEREDFEALRHLGHRMKGLGEPYGFPRISALGSRIEQSAREARSTSLASLVEQYADYLSNVQITYGPPS